MTPTDILLLTPVFIFHIYDKLTYCFFGTIFLSQMPLKSLGTVANILNVAAILALLHLQSLKYSLFRRQNLFFFPITFEIIHMCNMHMPIESSVVFTIKQFATLINHASYMCQQYAPQMPHSSKFKCRYQTTVSVYIPCMDSVQSTMSPQEQVYRFHMNIYACHYIHIGPSAVVTVYIQTHITAY